MLCRFMNFEEMLETADKAVFAQTGKHLNEAEMKVLEGAWQSKEYSQMAEDCGYSVSYLKRDIGPRLWKLLSEALGEEVSKRNFRAALKRKRFFVGDSVKVALTSDIYVERPPIENLCYEAIQQPGSLIRIKAPQQMGKTLLMQRVLAQVRQMSYRTVDLSFELADSKVFTDLRTFSQWFCANISDSFNRSKISDSLELEQKDPVHEYWSDSLGCNTNTTNYLQKYLLAQEDLPLVLALDNVDLVFEHPEIAEDFCRLIRAWYDLARRCDKRSGIWQRLRLMLVHSTEVYGSLDINHSPVANIGQSIELPDFTPEQVQELARRHGLNWDTGQVDKLMEMVGRHPYLVRQAFDYINLYQIPLEEFLKVAPTEEGPYRNHLLRHLDTLQQHPGLEKAFRQVLDETSSVTIESVQAFKLHSMGLVMQKGNSVMLRCDLYRQYFCDRLK